MKLSKERVAELIKAGRWTAFCACGKVFEEWVSVPAFDRQGWLDLLREGVARLTTR